jgi:thiamine biosynthesis lipoprotein
MMITHRFAAMGTDFEFIIEATPHAAAQPIADAESVVHGLEARLSRFRPDSELSLLNSTGRAQVSDDLFVLTQLALDAREDTGGRFDPTIGEAVAAAGYDHSFDAMPADVGPARRPVRHTRGVEIDGASGTITLDEHVALDLGGIAKGYAAEMAAEILADAGPCLVNAGGDIALRRAPTSGPWSIGVETPDGNLTLALRDGAVATSGRDRRNWRSEGRLQHHIIDPATDQPARSDVLRITVVAGNAVEAEMHATALFLAGSADAVEEAEALGLTAIVVTDAGRTLITGVGA